MQKSQYTMYIATILFALKYTDMHNVQCTVQLFAVKYIAKCAVWQTT